MVNVPLAMFSIFPEGLEFLNDQRVSHSIYKTIIFFNKQQVVKRSPRLKVSILVKGYLMKEITY